MVEKSKIPSSGKLLISEPALRDFISGERGFARGAHPTEGQLD